jgi:hypothetical protein
MIAGIDNILEEVQVSVKRNLSLNDDSIRMTFHLYGKNGVMGNHEPMKSAGHELGILLDVVAPPGYRQQRLFAGALYPAALRL